ncbi:type IX secretion system membrane protein, PorP/SprF family [Mariniphaga anaerophila]|uniref:Type IX secretion system membrane protein, PorP/SprF family n=2 Tax=Mariniphaga anaerophila TaxID=1484053 RepID=A0A1M4ZSK6_9BACT|nr:type IX secretion system membrane protein, PorP/SprF family [Mariniphaga anaerophila]
MKQIRQDFQVQEGSGLPEARRQENFHSVMPLERRIPFRNYNNKTMKKILLAFILLMNLTAFAQQDALFSQYMFNKLLVNPAYAGSREVFSVDLLNRYQWLGIEGAPRTISLSAHTILKNKKVGLGGYVYRDELGPTIDQGFMATYSYRIRTQNGWFSFGIQGGLKYFDFDWNAINTQYPDQMFMPEDVRKISPDANIGFYYQSPRFFAGISSKQLLENEYGVVEVDGKTTFSRLARHFYGMAGWAIPINDRMTFRPSALAKYTKNAPAQVDLNASFIFNNVFWLGASFRTEKAVVFLTEFQIAKSIRLGYSFDLYLNELQLHNRGSHEFRLGFDLPRKNERMKTPRYF